VNNNNNNNNNHNTTLLISGEPSLEVDLAAEMGSSRASTSRVSLHKGCGIISIICTPLH
jgi:hypothetical protein